MSVVVVVEVVVPTAPVRTVILLVWSCSNTCVSLGTGKIFTVESTHGTILHT